MMNNKKLGSDFERRMCEILRSRGWWVHFITSKVDGSQPFDIVAVRNGIALAADCKTSASATFGIDRLEDNQIMAFDLWLNRGNTAPKIFVLYRGTIRIVDYLVLNHWRRVNLKDQPVIEKTFIWGEGEANGFEDKVLYGGRVEGNSGNINA